MCAVPEVAHVHDWKVTGERGVYIEWQRREVKAEFLKCDCGREAFRRLGYPFDNPRNPPFGKAVYLIPLLES